MIDIDDTARYMDPAPWAEYDQAPIIVQDLGSPTGWSYAGNGLPAPPPGHGGGGATGNPGGGGTGGTAPIPSTPHPEIQLPPPYSGPSMPPIPIPGGSGGSSGVPGLPGSGGSGSGGFPGGIPGGILGGAGIGAIISQLINHISSGIDNNQNSPDLNNLAKQQASLSKMISDLSARQHTIAEPAINKSLQYYMKLASGGAAQRGALQSTTNNILGTYKGAESGLTRMAQPGPSRDRQVGELQREKAGKLAGLPFQAQQTGIQGLSQLGGGLNSDANSLLGSASGPLTGAANILNQQTQNKNASNANWLGLGSSIGSILLPYILGGGNN